MPDSKVSGLPAVAAFAGAQEFPVNDAGVSRKISGTQLIAAVAQGTTSWYVPVVANQGSITAEVDLTLLTFTLTTVANRRYKVTGSTLPSTTVANDGVALFITDGSNTHLNQAQVVLPVTGTGVSLVAILIHVPGAGSRTYKLRMSRFAGTGTITMNASSTTPAFLLIEDIGT